MRRTPGSNEHVPANASKETGLVHQVSQSDSSTYAASDLQIEGLDEGRALPIVQKTPHHGRPPDRRARRTLNGMIAATIDGLQDSGMSADEAYARTAKVLRAAGFTPTRSKKVTPRTLA